MEITKDLLLCHDPIVEWLMESMVADVAVIGEATTAEEEQYFYLYLLHHCNLTDQSQLGRIAYSQ